MARQAAARSRTPVLSATIQAKPGVGNARRPTNAAANRIMPERPSGASATSVLSSSPAPGTLKGRQHARAAQPLNVGKTHATSRPPDARLRSTSACMNQFRHAGEEPELHAEKAYEGRWRLFLKCCSRRPSAESQANRGGDRQEGRGDRPQARSEVADPRSPPQVAQRAGRLHGTTLWGRSTAQMSHGASSTAACTQGRKPGQQEQGFGVVANRASRRVM